MIANFLSAGIPYNELYVFSGQSNMNDRWGVAYLQSDYPEYYGLKPKIQRIKYPETEFTSLGTDSNYGADTSFLVDLQERKGRTIYAVKHSVGSTNIETWSNPATAQLFYLYETIDLAIAELLALNGKPTKIAGFIWVQGEANVEEGTSTASYQASLGNLINNLIRDQYDSPNCIFIYNYVKDYTIEVAPIENSEAIRAAQLAYNLTDNKSRLVDCRDLGTEDIYNVHYSNEAGVIMGQRFAAAFPQ